MIRLVGTVKEINSEVCGQYREVTLTVSRKSDVKDNLLLLVKDINFDVGDTIEVVGDVRTYTEDNLFYRTRLKVLVNKWVKVNPSEETPEYLMTNELDETVYVVQSSKMRRTPDKIRIIDLRLGKDKVRNGKEQMYSYNAIAWGANAKSLSEIPVGTVLHVKGRLQERSYVKKVGEEVHKLTTYEVSISTYEKEYDQWRTK